MDQGIAALVAGLTGMVGALGGAVAGGVAAVRGARIGAEKAFEAGRQQVQDQAAVELSHWLREQRREAYVSFIREIQVVIDAAKAVTTMEHDQLMNFNRSIEDLKVAGNSITLMGPQEMIEAAGRVIGSAIEFNACMWRESHTPDQRSQESLDASERTDDASDDFQEMKAYFVAAAQGVLNRVSQ